MPSLEAVERQIWEREGFRVKLVPLTAKVRSIPAYDFAVMAPQRWKISQWKNERLSQYVALLRDLTVFRGNGDAVRTDVQLGNLRDTYYQAEYGTLTLKPSNVVRLDRGR
jgi:hypothetical protein